MIKCIIKRIEKELLAADEYIELACEKRIKYPHTADLFIELAKEEIGQAERLIKEGQSLIDKLAINKDSEMYGHDLKRVTIWEYEKGKTLEEIMLLKHKITSYKEVSNV